MTLLHENIKVALHKEQILHVTVTTLLGGDPLCLRCRQVPPCLSIRQIEADHRVLVRHAAIGRWCTWCYYDVEDKKEFGETPCPDLLDLAARRDVSRT